MRWLRQKPADLNLQRFQKKDNSRFNMTRVKIAVHITAAQFTFNRDRGMDLSTFMENQEGIPEEDEETEEEGTPREQHRNSVDYTRPQLSDLDEGNKAEFP